MGFNSGFKGLIFVIMVKKISKLDSIVTATFITGFSEILSIIICEATRVTKTNPLATFGTIFLIRITFN